VQEGASWSRRDIVVGDDNQCIMVKFWNDNIPMLITPGNKMLFKNLKVDVFKDRVSLNSTEQTTIQVCL